jgi:transposase InsO family protein
LRTTPELLAKLDAISISTVGRILSRIRQDEPRLPRKGPESANRVARQIPMTRIPWNETQPGHLEIDLVHHCGTSAEGEYVHTLQMVDVATGWSERVAVLGRSYLVMRDAFRYTGQRIPFPLLELHSDNGAEFLNQHIVRFWKDDIPHLDLSRSRPYCKNDNRFVEQKNDTLVRAYFGNDRLDSVAQVLAMNEIYEEMWLYYNFFQPVMRLADKVVVSENGRTMRVKRVFDDARTAFDRLCATDAIPPDQRATLKAWRQEINPRALRRKIYAAIQQLFKLPGAVPGQTENVYDTLFFPETYDLD